MSGGVVSTVSGFGVKSEVCAISPLGKNDIAAPPAVISTTKTNIVFPKLRMRNYSHIRHKRTSFHSPELRADSYVSKKSMLAARKSGSSIPSFWPQYLIVLP